MIYLIFFMLLYQNQENDILSEINNLVKEIDTELKLQSNTKKVDIRKYADKFTESSTVTKLSSFYLDTFEKNETLLKIEINIESENRDIKSSYYIKNKKLIYVKKRYKDYIISKTNNKFDPTKYDLSENAYFFHSKKLIQWINPLGKKIIKKSMILTMQESMILDDLKNYHDLIK